MSFSDTLCIEARPIWGAFLTSSRYEYAFWEMASTMETWPV